MHSSIIVALVCLVAATAAVPAATEITREQIVALSNSVHGKCAEEHNVSDAISQLFRHPGMLHTVDPTVAGVHCYAKCVMDGFSLVKADHTFDIELIKANNKVAKRYEEAALLAKLEACQQQTAKIESCEDAWKASLCFDKA